MNGVVWIEAQPRDPATGAVQTVRLAGGGGAAPYLRDGNHYRAGVARLPRFRAALEFGEDGWTGGTVPQTSRVAFRPADRALLEQLAALFWLDAPIAIDVGPEAGPWPRVLTATVVGVGVGEIGLDLEIADLSARLDKPVVTERFAGSGGLEGGAEAEGRPKRRSWGFVFNLEGRILDKANNLYEFGDPSRSWQEWLALRDMGRGGAFTLLGWQGTAAATLAALAASAPVQGGGVVAPSIACAKWWTQPAGPLTADVRGEIGAGYVETAPQIAARLSAAVAGPALANEPEAVAWRGDIAGLHVGEIGETAAAALDRLLLGQSLLWVLEPTGDIRLRQWSFAAPAETLRSAGITRRRLLAPTRARRVGFQRSHRLHSDGEISAAVQAADVIFGNGDTAEYLRPAGPGATKGATAGADLYRADGATVMTQPEVRTAEGTSLYFANQAPVATDQDAVPRIAAARGDNLVRNGFLEEGSGHFTYASNVVVANTASYFTGAQPSAQCFLFNGSLVYSTLFVAQPPIRAVGLKAHCSGLFRSGGGVGPNPIFAAFPKDAAGAALATVTAALAAPDPTEGWAERRTVLTLPQGTATYELSVERAASGWGLWFTGLRVSSGEQGATLGARAGGDLYRSDGATVMTQAEVRTIEGTALFLSGEGALARKNAVDLATAEVLNKSLANVDAAANTKLGGIAAGATVGGTVGTNVYGPTGLVLPRENVLNEDLALESDLAGTGGRARVRLRRGASTYNTDLQLPAGVQNIDQQFDQIVGGFGKPEVDATKSRVFRQATAPTTPTLNDVWVDTSVTPNVAKTWDGAAWQSAANLTTNTNQLADGANLGGTAAWTGVSSRPAELTDGRVAAGLTATGDVGRAIPAAIRTSSDILSRTGGGLFSGALDATLGADINANVSDSFVTGNPLVPRGDLRTSIGTAAFLNGQGAWATRSKATVSYGDADVTGFGALAPREDVYFDSGFIREAAGGANATLGNFKTSQGTAAFLNGEGALARLNTADWATRVTGAGKPEDSADVTSGIVGPADIPIASDHNGAAKTGVLPKATTFSLVRNGVTITSGITWTYEVVTGTVNGIAGPSAAQAITGGGSISFSVASIGTAQAKVRLKAVYAGTTRVLDVMVTKQLDPPPVSGSGGGTSASTSTIGSTNSATYGAANISILSVTAGANGTVSLSAPLSYEGAATCTAYGKWQWRVPAGTWADVAVEIAADINSTRVTDPELGTVYTDPGSISVAQSKAALTNGSTYEFQLLLRTNVATVTNYFGTASAQGS